MKFKKNADISSLLTIRPSDARADLFIPDNIDDVVQFSFKEKKYHVLGGGSNVIAGDLKWPVLYMGTPLGDSVTEDLDEEYVTAYLPAGVKNGEFLKYLSRNGFSGAEFLAGIPGTIGGAIMGNAAPKGASWDGIVNSMVFVENGEVQKITPSFSYRSMENKPFGPFIALAFELQLKKESPETVAENIRSYLKKRIRIPYPSAGSFFKNPEGDFAARLIEGSGLKGFNVNDAAIYENHANIVINRGAARSVDFAQLRDHIVGEVYVRYQTILENEVRFLNQEEK